MKRIEKFDGKHCETTATGTLLAHRGVTLSEPMMLGLSQGFGFIYWKMHFMNLPFIGGRARPFDLTKVLCQNLNIAVDVRETTSKKRAWKNCTDFLDAGVPVGLQVDCYHLEHFNHAFHFAGHFISAYDYDDEFVFVYDTGVSYKVSIENLEKARFEKGSMAAKARSYTMGDIGEIPAIEKIIPKALHAAAQEFLNPPLKCFGYKGIQKLGTEMLTWLDDAPNPRVDLHDQFDMMENGGTGGAIFRNFYRDYLSECLSFFPSNKKLQVAAESYKESASQWSEVALLIKQAGETLDASYLQKASSICFDISQIEKEAMESLLDITC